jgi:hypothetical protein
MTARPSQPSLRLIIKDQSQNVKSRIDSKAEIIETIDFSFKEIIALDGNFQKFLFTHFRINLNKQVIISELKDVEPRCPDKREPKKTNGKYNSLGIKLGYNALNEIAGLYEYCTLNFAFPSQINSLDLSFNCFMSIPQVRF